MTKQIGEQTIFYPLVMINILHVYDDTYQGERTNVMTLLTVHKSFVENASSIHNQFLKTDTSWAPNCYERSLITSNQKNEFIYK